MKRGNVIDIVLSPLFVTVVALGIVLLTVLNTIQGIGSSDDFNKAFYSADMALTTSSLYAPRKDVNFVGQYYLTDLGVQVTSKKINVYKQATNDGKTFWFDEDPDLRFTYASYPPKAGDQVIRYYKSGNTLGYLLPDRSPPTMATPYCEQKPLSKQYRSQLPQTTTDLLSIDSRPVEISTGDVIVKAIAKQSTQSTLRITVKNEADSIQAACLIAKGIIERMPDIQGYAIVPTSLLVSPTDPKYALSSAQGIGIFVEYAGPTTQDAKSRLVQALQSEVRSIG